MRIPDAIYDLWRRWFGKVQVVDPRAIAEKGRAHVLAEHTYTTRMRQLLELLRAEGLL